MPRLPDINKGQKKLKWWLVLYAGVILWIHQSGITAGAKCGRPGRTRSSNYKPAGEAFKEKDVIHYSCRDDDHAILGVYKRECLSNGLWSYEMPVCCKLAKIERMESLSEVDGTTLNYLIDGDYSTCSNQLQIEKTTFIGYFSSFINVTAVRITFLEMDEVNIDVAIQENDDYEEQKCVRKIADPEITVKSTKTATFYCPEGTIGNNVVIKSKNQNFRICEVLVLLPPVQSCLIPDMPLHGSGQSKFSKNLQEYQFSCHTGFKRWGALSVQCQADGRWSPKSPRCEEISCYIPTSPPNGYIENDSHLSAVPYNGKILYNCDEGYILEGNATITCHRWNEWDSPVPKCLPQRPETSASVNNSLLTESWMEVHEETCGRFNMDGVQHGTWLSVNGTGAFLVLICPEGFHIEGSPAVTHCLPNGSWSYTTAVCKSFLQSEWGSNWSPSLMLMSAVAAGAGTAIFLLCFAVAFFIIKKRRQTQANTTVFHLENVYEDGELEKDIRPQKHLLKSESYETIVERRWKSTCPVPRKPRSALPNIPLDTDPVYAQPFETAIPKKLSSATAHGKDDIYNAHIYAEPVDSRTPSNIPANGTLPITRKEPTETVVKIKVENESPNLIPTETPDYHKNNDIYDSTDWLRRNH